MAGHRVLIAGGATLAVAAAVALWLSAGLRDREGPLTQAAAPTQAPLPTPAAQPATAAVAPRFDVVRISREGEALVAGQALPGAAVTLRVDGEIVAQAAADAAGQFVALFALGPSEAMQVMTLDMADSAGTLTPAEDSVMLTPRPAPATEAAAPTAEAAPEAAAPETAPATETTAAVPEAVAPETAPATETAAAVPEAVAPETAPATETAAAAPEAAAPETVPATETAAAAPEAVAPEPAPATQTAATAPATETAATSPETPATADGGPTAILMRADGSVEVLDRAPQVMDSVVIDAITYSDSGDVQISGRAAGGDTAASLRIYLDNRPIAVAQAEGGDWQLDLPAIDAGVYTLRVDQLDAEGAVESRFETPFQRESRQTLAEARARTGTQPAEAPSPAPEAPRAALITVQPGHTLWAISRDRYGEGDRYMVIFNANRGQIRDPDWIYPGQVFALPEN